jgi:MYXO-CTERM domain-containing protein
MRKLAMNVITLASLWWLPAKATVFEANFADTAFSTAPFAFVADDTGMLLAGHFAYDDTSGAAQGFRVQTTAGTTLSGFDYGYARLGGAWFFGSSQAAVDNPLAPGERLIAFFEQAGFGPGLFDVAEMACPTSVTASCAVMMLRQGLEVTVQLGDGSNTVIDGATRWATLTLSTTPVPEPVAVAPFGLALLALSAVLRQQRRRRSRPSDGQVRLSSVGSTVPLR